jgi:hypothetical protein
VYRYLQQKEVEAASAVNAKTRVVRVPLAASRVSKDENIGIQISKYENFI